MLTATQTIARMKFPLSNFVFSNNYGKAKRQMMAELRIATPNNLRVSHGRHIDPLRGAVRASRP
jgi:hypothetical protein